MTAGRGIAHSERFEDPAVLAGGNFEMIQTWVALPEKDEESPPAFNNYKPSNYQSLQTRVFGCDWLPVMLLDWITTLKHIPRFLHPCDARKRMLVLGCPPNIQKEEFM